MKKTVNEMMLCVIDKAEKRYGNLFEEYKNTWLSMPEIQDEVRFNLNIYMGDELFHPVRDAVKGLLAPVSNANVTARNGYVMVTGLEPVGLKRLWPVAKRLSEECILRVCTEDGDVMVWHELIPYLMFELY